MHINITIGATTMINGTNNSASLVSTKTNGSIHIENVSS